MCIVGLGLDQPILLAVPTESAKNNRQNVNIKLSSILNEVNSDLEGYKKIKKIVFVKDEWLPDNGLATPTLKIKRAKIVAKYAEKRKALKEAGDYEGLQKLPKNASPIRMHNRCKLTGRPKGYMRNFGISRVLFREMANKGLIPGVKKASW